MSKTRKTDPSWVRMYRNPALLAIEHHDHRVTGCDLPVSLDDQYASDRETNCSYGWSLEMSYGRDSGCPCEMCHGGHWHRRQRRRSRQDSRRELGELVKQLNSGTVVEQL